MLAILGRHLWPKGEWGLRGRVVAALLLLVLAKITNDVQRIADDGAHDGFIWTQGSPQVEEIAYWFNLLIDTTKPICCNAAQRPQGMISNDGPMNIVSSAQWIASRIWADGEGRNRCGTVVIQEQQVFAAREVAKAGLPTRLEGSVTPGVLELDTSIALVGAT